MKPKTIKVRPKLDYRLLGTEIQLDRTKTYDAVEARHIPDWEKRGLLWVNEILLERGEYEIIEP